MKKLTYSIFIVATLFITSCNPPETVEKEEEEKQEKPKTGTFTTKAKDGQGKKEFTVVDGKKEGLSKEYYPSGKIRKETNYKGGSLDGKATIYYETGKLKRESEYKKGKRHGKYIKYFKSGNLKAKMHYTMDLPLPGLKEIDFTKKEIKQPTIKIRHEDLLVKGQYNLHFSLSTKAKNVKFYVFDEGGQWLPETILTYYALPKVGGEHLLKLEIPYQHYVIREFYIYATYTSRYGMEAVTFKKMNFAVEND